MNLHFQILTQTRNNIKRLTDGLSMEQLNHIPAGFNNNLIWNLGHVLVTQQLLMYKLSNTPMLVPNEWVGKYRKGTKPNEPVSSEEKDQILLALDAATLKAKEDFEQNVFSNFNPYSTSFGIDLNTVEDALQFNCIHEGMHYGTMLALKKLIP